MARVAEHLSDEVKRRFYRNYFKSKKKAFSNYSKKYADGKNVIEVHPSQCIERFLAKEEVQPGKLSFMPVSFEISTQKACTIAGRQGEVVVLEINQVVTIVICACPLMSLNPPVEECRYPESRTDRPH